MTKLFAAFAVAFVLAACATTAPSVGAPKGYSVADITVTDAVAYRDYVTAVGPVVARYGGTYLVRGGQIEAKEGAPPAGRYVVIEFESLAAARAFYGSPEYQAILPLREKAATSRVFLVEGAPRS
jgi:uncharacterized protein (DUF1330 family)